MTRKIGLKLANGEFYPVLDEGSIARKRLVVTTVQDSQRSVQIDIYRGAGGSVAGAEYAGSLVIDNIPEAPRGEPDIRVDLGLDEDGKLTAYAEELSSGEHQSLEVSLEALSEEDSYEIPDFEFEEETDSLPSEKAEESGGGLLAAAASFRESSMPEMEEESLVPGMEEEPLLPSMEEAGDSPAPAAGEGAVGEGLPDFGSDMSIPDFGEEEAPAPVDRGTIPDFDEEPGPSRGYTYSGEEIVGSPVAEDRARGRKPLAVALVVAAILLVALGGAWAVYRFLLQPQTGTIALSDKPTPAASAQPAPVPVQPAPSPAPAATSPAPSAPKASAPAAAAAPAPATTKATPPATPAKQPGVNYRLKWGDTLWDLAYTFYRNPWLYGKIAKANKIKNPDHIISGRTIWIPPLK